MIRFPPPPFVHAMSFSLEETGTDQTNPTFRGLQNWFWRACFMGPKIARYVLPPPPLRIPNYPSDRPPPNPCLFKIHLIWTGSEAGQITLLQRREAKRGLARKRPKQSKLRWAKARVLKTDTLACRKIVGGFFKHWKTACWRVKKKIACEKNAF